ncbi:MAG: tyrosine-type recombinase/integrase [Terracidiphilus sp.]
MGKFIHGGLRSAQAHLNRKLAERDLGRNIRSSRQTVGQYLDHWLDICARPRLRAKSFRDYSGLLARYVRPHLGSRSFGELAPAEIQKLYSDLLKRKLSPRTICYTHAVLFSALRQAVRWKLLLANPAEDVHLPRQPRRRFTVFDVSQAKQFIAAISGHEYEALFALALTTGMRPSEYLALTWTDFDLERGTVSVSKTLERRRGGWCFEDTKRERSRRMIKLQNWVLALLRKLGERSKPVEPKPEDLVFMSNSGGPVHESKFVGRHFKPLLRLAGLPNIRLYDLRHTAATLALSAGVSPKVVSEQLGHASVAFTLEVYSHVLPHMQETAAMRVEALLMVA